MTEINDERHDRIARDRIDEIRTGYLQWARWTLWILIAIVVIQVGFGIVSVYLWDRINDRFHDTLVIECLDINARHDAAIVKLDDVLRKEVKDPAQREDIRKNNVILIDALVPKFPNCEARATQVANLYQ